MSIPHLTRNEFERIIQKYVRPSSPIESFEYLFDRERQLNRIEEALASPGRHVFIYGDRGAGKTSLAKSAAYKHHPSDGSPIFSACGQQTTFAAIVSDIAHQLDGRSAFRTTDKTLTTSVRAMALEVGYSSKESPKDLRGLDLNSATAAIKEGAERRTGRSVIVIDEFEALPSIEDRHMFAELIKQLSDRSVPVSLIFCGIGKSLDDLLQGHNSAHRYIEEVRVPSPPLSYSGRWAIIDSASQAIGLIINEDSRLRIAQVSDGFPHYIHLIVQKLFWAAFRSSEISEVLSPDNYMEAVREALGSVESRLRNSYDIATKKDDDNYQEILWSVADHYELERNNRRIYAESYLRVMRDVARPPLSFDAFQTRLTNLRSERHGKILTSERRGWIRFSENLLRGYVRLVAESQGVRLALEHERGPEPKTLTASSRSTGPDPTFPRPTYGRPKM
ncbi:AAA family ATPase [Achromobacter xylosoxidans]|uniref:AAA family ATPase n=1 Tax=Alcaligenes xylosoxydans xylosoxydans TaxID=85698 RepID=UPI0019040E31|nr:ATP-binding protein [Achromobacter xylosoxidans]MBK1977313.1 AAA family ATPase [Achromobacter xylosoxidans]